MRLLAWLDDRLGVVELFKAAMSEKRPPLGIGWLRTLGFAALTAMVLQVLSGIAIAFHYVPSTSLAYDSVRALEQDVPGGRFARALHYFGASAFVIVAALHLARVYFTGAYKAPREFTWLTGVGLFVIVLAFGFTGYLLPWDQKAYFATKVGTQIAGKAPVLGEHIKQILNGGNEVGAPTLTRFYVIHVVLLPLALLGLVGLHMYLIQRHGIAPPGARVDDPGVPGKPFFPYHTAKEVLVGAALAGGLFYLAATKSAPLEALAEPSDTEYDPRPDWYFAGLFQLLKVFKGPLEPIGSFWLPNVLLIGLTLLPFLDRNKERDWRKRKFVVGIGLAVCAGAVALTWIGVNDHPKNVKQLDYPLGLTEIEKEGYRLVRRLKCVECHKAGDVGKTEHDAPDLHTIDQKPDVVAEILKDPRAAIDSEDMPDFAHVDEASRYAIGVYLQWLHESKRSKK